jgi:hypothetical protein
MNYTQSFDEFAASLGPTDVALYAGAAIILWVLFKDKLNPVSSFIKSLVGNLTSANKLPSQTETSTKPVSSNTNSEDLFFQLVTSWKKTRDLAQAAKCEEAVKVADEMFPYLSPTVCNKEVV